MEEFDTWVEPREAVERLSHLNARTARLQIYGRLKGGHLRTIARRCTHGQDKLEFVGLNMATWEQAESRIAASSFWTTGDIQIGHLLFYGVRFDPVGLDEFSPAVLQQTSPAIAKDASPAPMAREPSTSMDVERRGRPPKEWWDDLWVEMCRKIYEDGFAPKTQADIERAMLDWATSHDHEMNESTAKRAARKLFPIFKE